MGSWQRASWKIADVVLPIIMLLVGGVPVGMAWSQGRVAWGFTRLSGERAFVSRFSIIVVTRAGLFVNSPIYGSRMEERLVGFGYLSRLFLEEVSFKMDMRVCLGFLMNMATRSESYLL